MPMFNERGRCTCCYRASYEGLGRLREDLLSDLERVSAPHPLCALLASVQSSASAYFAATTIPEWFWTYFCGV